jgi:Caenorhabditis protein of unknown function, DUF268
MVDEVRNGTHVGTYGVATTNGVRDDLSTLPIRGKSILVIGTEKPWVEAILLFHGAAKVTTLEYSKIRSERDQVKTLRPHRFRESFMAGTLERFDGIVYGHYRLQLASCLRSNSIAAGGGQLETVAKYHRWYRSWEIGIERRVWIQVH